MNHIDLTIADLEAARERASVMIQSLREFQSGVLGGPSPSAPRPSAPAESVTVQITPTAQPLTEIRRRSPEPIARAAAVPQGTAKQGKGAPRGAFGEKLNVAMLRLKQPFQFRDLVKATDVNPKTVHNFLAAAVKGKRLQKLERGTYQLVEPKGQPATTPKRNKPTLVTRATPVKAQPSGNAVVSITTEQSLGIKPSTLGAAMKQVALNAGEFTGAQLRDALRADADYAKLLDQSPTGFVGNLAYWTTQGYLERNGDGALEAVYTVTKAGREFFAKGQT